MTKILFRNNNRTFQYLSLGLSSLIVLSLLLGMNATTLGGTVSEDPPELEMMFSGVGSQRTKPVTLDYGWEVEWETTAPPFKLSAYGVTETGYEGTITEQEQILRSFETYQPLVLANSMKFKGKAFHRVGGTFYFKIVTSGSWTLHLKIVKPTKDYLDVPYTAAP